MPYPYLSTTILSGITGEFEGGNLAYVDGRYVLLDSTPTAPRLIVLSADFDAVRSVSLPVSNVYVGVTYFGSSAVVLRRKGTLCTDGRIAVGELVSVSLVTGELIEIQEIYSFENITLLGGITAPPDGLLFAGQFGSARNFYRLDGQNVINIADFSETVAGIGSLGYDGSDIFMLNGTDEAIAFNARWLNRDTAQDTALETANADPIGVSWNGSALVVLDSNPLSVFLYGTDNGGGSGISGQVGLTENRQLFISDNRLEDFTIGTVQFQGVHSEFIRRVPVQDGAVLRFAEVLEVRVTPKFVLTGVDVGTEIRGYD